jgi:hypothetical protein
MVTYRIVITDLAGTQLGELMDFKSLTFRKVLNREGECYITMPLKSENLTPNLVLLGLRDVYVYRNDDIVWGGRLRNVTGALSGGDDYVTLVASGFMVLLKKRLAISPQTNTDAGEIIWNWIDESQDLPNGDLGITLGTIVPSKDRDRTYLENTTIYDEAVQLTEVKDGIDIEVTQTKVFNAYYPQGTDKSSSVIFSWGKNIERLDFGFDFSDPVNQAIVLGGGFGEAMVTVTRNDTALQTDYGLLQENIPYKNVEELALLQDKGDKEIARRGLPRREYKLYQTPESDPVWTSLTVGDRIRGDVDYGFLSVHDSIRINVIEVVYSEGVEKPSYSFIYG